ncbi:MAG: tetratricopeptide repeat protein, partial [Thermoguttaceae bacterium]
DLPQLPVGDMRQILKNNSHRSEAYHRLAILYDQTGNATASEKNYKIALKKNPKNAELLADYGYHYYLQKRLPEAESNLRRAIALDSRLARAHNNLGLLLAITGRQNEALAEFAKAGCKEAEARSNLAFALTMRKRWSDAQQQLELALAADPHSKTVKNRLETLQSLRPELKLQEKTNLANKQPSEKLVLEDRSEKKEKVEYAVNSTKVHVDPNESKSQRAIYIVPEPK